MQTKLDSLRGLFTDPRTLLLLLGVVGMVRAWG